ncbi:MAG: DUF3883 domain-containing protein [Bacteroidetes bacterium]|nr:DUF3883 domain-containing protein [Bacteroidota bacterium]
MQISKGDVVSGPKWNTPLKVDLIEDLGGGYIRILGTFINPPYSKIDQIFNFDEYKQIQVSKVELDFSADPLDVFLALECTRYRFIAEYDPLLAINTSKVDPLPHQIDAVYGIVLKKPRIRFLIADDPGAGKTIMAGLIIKELKLRNLVNRILIVTPGHLKDQWRRELKERFEETFIINDRGMMDAFYGENTWQRENQIITSIDFAKQDEIIQTLNASRFDLIIVDEAHKLSAYQYGNKIQKSKRYRLGETLSDITEHLLFLTATPHKGDPENFRLFLDLLEKGFFATNQLLEDSIRNNENPLFVRRIKEDLKDFDGKPIFLPRTVTTLSFNLGRNSHNEALLYNKLSEYVTTQFNKALQRDKKRNVAFALVILQRRFASSIYALWRSLERRKKKLEDLLNSIDTYTSQRVRDFDFDEIDDLDEEDRWEEEEKLIALSASENRQELEKEIDTLKELIIDAKKIIDNEEEIKLKELKATLEKLDKTHEDAQIIIFTEAKDTLDYLEKRIKFWGYSTLTIHGGMRLEERIEAEKKFKNDKARVLIATEAAGEGINLQFCNLMINYDLPWNPNRLEQRMGRIHRYGQTREVFIFNLVAEDTREGSVLHRLMEKLDEIRNALGDKVFDVISEILYGKNLSQLLVEASLDARDIHDILEEIDIKVDEKYIQQIKDNLGDTLATRYIDYTRINELNEKAREYRLIPEYTESFFIRAFEKLGGSFSTRKDHFYNIDKIPFELKSIAQSSDFKKKFGSLLQHYRKVTFDKDAAFKEQDAEFLSFGHPLFESLMQWIENKLLGEIKKGAVFVDPENNLNGTILYYEGAIKDGKGDVTGKRLFSYYADEASGTFTEFNPSLIWDLSFSKKGSLDNEDIEPLKSKAIPLILNNLENYKNELLEERNRQAEIKQRYGIRSLDDLILNIDNDLISLEDRKNAGDNVDLVMRNKKDQQQVYERAKTDLILNIEKERNLSIEYPRFIGAIRVIPPPTGDVAMKSDKEVELIGMKLAMDYELEKGRNPLDVSAKNVGYDVLSEDGEGKKRRIEVKARAVEGSIILTTNEMFKARRYGDEYYLYVVYNANSNPYLTIINNPAESLEATEKKEVVRFMIDKKEITDKGTKV